jgi:hypothetical protein
MDTSLPSTPPPPAYEDRDSPLEYLWRICNTKICSQFYTKTPAHIQTYRDHMEQMHESSSKSHHSKSVEVHYNQAFADIGRLIYEYRDSLSRIKPLQEEEVLFLLLSQYAQTSGFGVYMEIRQPTEVQVYDSSICIPSVGDNSQLRPSFIATNNQRKQKQ